MPSFVLLNQNTTLVSCLNISIGCDGMLLLILKYVHIYNYLHLWEFY